MTNFKWFKIKDIATVRTGPFGTLLHEQDYVDVGTPIITVEHLSEQGIVHDNLPLVSNEDKERLSSFILKEGDVVFSRVGAVDRSSVVTSKEDGWLFSGRLLRVRPDPDKVCFKYLNQYFQTQKFRNYITRMAVGGTMPSLNTNILENIEVFLPNLPYQKRLSSILEIWDLAIKKTEKIIFLKLHVKQGIMQQFLIGRKRLKNFHGAWHEHRLGDLFKERNEQDYKHLPLLSITREEGVIPRVEVNRKDTSSEDKSRYLRICPGDIGYNTMRMWQGVSALSTLEGIVSPAYTICTPKDWVDGEFMAYLFKLPKTIHLFYRYSQGLTSDTWNLKFRHFREIKVTIPDIEEQKAIADILRTYDEEIVLLKKKLEALKKQKRGLMQKLLTGQWRLRTA